MNKENISRVQRQLAHMIAVDPTARAKRLYNLVYHPEWLATALERVLRNTGSQTPGVDGVTVRQVKDEAFKRAFFWRTSPMPSNTALTRHNHVAVCIFQSPTNRPKNGL